MNDSVKKETTYNNLEIKSLPGSEVEFIGEIPVTVVETFRTKAVRNIAKHIELPGFRKGNVPEEMAAKHVGEVEVLKETAELALGKVYADIVTDKAIDVVGRPNITITKLAPGNPIGFKIQSAVFPMIELPEYKKIAENERKKFEKEKVIVEEKDIENELKRLQEMMTPKKEDGTVEGVVPEINDEFAQTLGGFKDLAELKEKMKEQMLLEKENSAREKKRLTIAEAVIEKSKVDVPALFIEGELDQMVASFTDRVERAGMKLDAYLEQVKKTLEELRKEWRVDAEKRAKLQLIFNEIAKKESLAPDAEKLDREIAHIREHYPEAKEESVRIYVSAQMTNEKVFEMLEGKKKDDKKEGHVHDEKCEHGHDHAA
jgi:FKBP-type peptidyl-prolyl cis-trans isomerase (trigger factor)